MRQCEGNGFRLCKQLGHAEKLYGALNRIIAYLMTVQLLPALQSSLVIVGGIHVEKAQAFGIETTDFVLNDLTSPNLIEEINRPQLPTVQLFFEQRQHAGAVDRVQRLETILPEGTTTS